MRNHKPNDVVNSHLFKQVAPFITSISNARLVYELCLASTTTNVNFDRGTINEAFTWSQSPQRDVFWSPLNREAVVNVQRHRNGEAY